MRFLLRPSTHAYRGLFDRTSCSPCLIGGNQNLKSYFIKHIGISSTYQQKNSLKDALQVVYHRLNGDLDSKLGPLSEKAVLIEKLVEGISACTPGFHNRVNTILESFHIPQNFSELLYLVRKHLVEKAATSLKNNDVHTVNRVTVIASTDGLGIKPNFAGDIYPGYLSDQTIPSESLCSRKILAVVSPKFVRITRLILSPDSSGVRHALAHSGLRAVATTMT